MLSIRILCLFFIIQFKFLGMIFFFVHILLTSLEILNPCYRTCMSRFSLFHLSCKVWQHFVLYKVYQKLTFEFFFLINKYKILHVMFYKNRLLKLVLSLHEVCMISRDFENKSFRLVLLLHDICMVLWLQTIKAIINSCKFKGSSSDEPRRVQVLDLYCLTRFESENSRRGNVY